MRAGVVVLVVLGLALFRGGFEHSIAAPSTVGGRSDAAPCGQAGSDAERQAVEATVKLYFQGHATGKGDFFAQAFHSDAKLFWIKDGALAQRTSAEFVAGAKGKPADDEARRVRRIAMIDVSGDAAVAKVELFYPDAMLVDYLSLLKVDGKWVVINKIFHRAPPKPVPSSR